MGCKHSQIKPLQTGRHSADSKQSDAHTAKDSADVHQIGSLSEPNHGCASSSPCTARQEVKENLEISTDRGTEVEQIEISDRDVPVTDSVQLEVTNLDEETQDTQHHQQQQYVIDRRNRCMRPKAAKGERKRPDNTLASGTTSLPSCVREFEETVDKFMSSQSAAPILTRPKAAKGVRTPHVCIFEEYLSLPGMVTSESDRMPTALRPQLTVKGLRTPQDEALDDWIRKVTDAGKI